MRTIRRLAIMAAMIYLLLWLTQWYERRRLVTVRPPHVAAYLDAYGRVAAEVGEATGVPPALILAVAGLESAWGTSELAREGGNHFGIKARDPNEPRYCLPTREFTGGRAHVVRACFRSYEEVADSFRDYARLISTDPRYRGLLRYNTADYQRWAYGLQDSGYATDPEYAEKIIRVVRQYGLYME